MRREDLAAVADQLNFLARRTVGLESPAQALDEFLASAAA